MIVKIFNTNIKIIVFIQNKSFILDYINPISSNNKFIFGWVFLNNKRFGYLKIPIKKNVKHVNVKIVPNGNITIYLENGNCENKSSNFINKINYNLYYDKKYDTLIPEWISENIKKTYYVYDYLILHKLYKQYSYNEFILLLNKYIKNKYTGPTSVSNIKNYINNFGVDIINYDLSNINNFNDFFIRRKKNYKYKSESNVFHSPVDGYFKLLNSSNICTLKNINIKLDGILNMKKFKNIFYFRLSPNDYHRIHCPYYLKLINISFYKGNDLNKKHFFYHIQKCVLTFIDLNGNKTLLFLLGSIFDKSIIINDNLLYKWITPCTELGYFSYGGSSIIVLTQNVIDYNLKIFKHYESKIRLHDDIGKIINNNNINTFIKKNFNNSRKHILYSIIIIITLLILK